MEGEKAGSLNKKRFRLFGIPFQTSIWFFPFVTGIGWFVSDYQLSIVPLFVVAMTLVVVAHEFGHALVGRWFGGRDAEVYLTFFGGYCQFRYANFTRRMEMAMTAAGPLVNLLSAGLVFLLFRFGLIHDTHFYVQKFLVWFCAISLVLGLFNLMPVLPLDGGHILRLLVGRKNFHWVALVGVIVCLAMILLGLRFRDWVLLAGFAYFGKQNAGTFLAWWRLRGNNQ